MMTPKERAVVSIQNESETVSSLSMMRTVMQQALEALEEMFHSNSTKVAVEKYNTAHNALLEALEQPDEIDWIETNKALSNEIIELKKQAEQEPVAWFVQYKNRHEFVFGSKPEFIVDGVVEPLYAHPVRTKDLTDDEIMKINVDTAGIVPTCDRQFHFARAVIVADREKNK